MAGGAREPCAGRGGVTGRGERGTRDARGAELEATRIDVARRVTARAVAVERCDGEVIGRRGDEGDVGEGRRHRRAVTAQTPGQPLVRAWGRVLRVVVGRGMALRARGGGWNVIGRLGGLRHVRREGRCRGVTAAAVAGGRVHLVEGLRTGISPGGRAARHHPEVGGALVAGLAGGDPRGHGGVAGDRERRSGQARAAELEATRAHVRGAVTARAVAVEGAHGEVIGRRGGDREYGIGGDAECPGDVRAMAAQTPADPLVDSGD